MKKVYDWDVGLAINVQNNNKNINIVCSVHTNIHQLKLQICKKLNLMIFDTQLDLYYTSHLPMKSTSTLLQNGIEKGQHRLKAVLKRVKKNNPIDVRVENTYDRKQEVKKKSQNAGCGLQLVATCTNQSCINYQQDTDIHIGYGHFPFYQLISSLKCQVCPYKNQHLRPSMMCKGVKLSYCNYRLDGRKTDHQGIPSDMNTKWISLKEEKDVLKKMLECDWDKNFVLSVKQL